MQASDATTPSMARVSDVMSTEVVCCLQADDIAAAARLMHRTRLERLPVVDDNGRLVGMVSLGDLTGRFRDDAD